MASNEQIAKDFVESTINDNKHILDQVSPLPSPQSPVAPPPPTHSPPAPPARNPPNEMSEEEIHEKTNRLVERMFAFANETTKKKKRRGRKQAIRTIYYQWIHWCIGQSTW